MGALAKKVEREPDREALLALLRSVSDELYALVSEIMRLGEALSSDELAGDRNRRICDLQSFDLLAQTALAQSRLLQGIERGLAADGRNGFDGETIRSLIDAVPFHKARQRLASAYRGLHDEPALSLPWDDAGEPDWF